MPVTPESTTTATKRIGITIGPAYDFPFSVEVTVDPDIGGPSAGLMFSLAIYDTLTPGSLTGDDVVAGTGTIDVDGTVGPIGGIQQKIVGAREAGAELFLVPADNCEDAQGARNGDMRLVRRPPCTTRAIASRRGPTTTTPTSRPAATALPSRRPADGRPAARPARGPAPARHQRPRRRPRPGGGRPRDRGPRRERGLGRPGRLYALVDTAQLVAHEPSLAAVMGLDASSEQGSLTAIEQDQVPPTARIEELLEQIVWPDGVAGCAAVVERLVLPPDADDQLPEDPAAAEEFAREHPDRQEVRIVAGVTRAGSTYCALRLRAHDDDHSVVAGADLVPGLTRPRLAVPRSDDQEVDVREPDE